MSKDIEALTNALPFVVQYRRKDGGIRWTDMAAFDHPTIAESYRDKCVSDDPPWEYRVDHRRSLNQEESRSEESKNG